MLEKIVSAILRARSSRLRCAGFVGTGQDGAGAQAVKPGAGAEEGDDAVDEPDGDNDGAEAEAEAAPVP